MLHRMLPPVAAGLALLATPALLAAGEGWVHNMDAAMKTAKEENKLILIDFTGSDWCYWCKRLDSEVFSTDAFKSVAPSHYVLVELDFPRQTELPEDQKAHNDEWKDRFEITGYPTIMLTDAEGKPYARTGYREGGPESYLEHLTELREGKAARDEALAAAKMSEGVERARHLDKALGVENIVIEDRLELMTEVVALDANDEAGLKSKYEQLIRDMKIDEALPEIQQVLFNEQDPERALEMIAKLETEQRPSPNKQAEINQIRVMALKEAGRTDEAFTVIAKTVAMEEVDIEVRQQVKTMEIQFHLETGNKEAARKAFEDAIRMAPDSDFGKMLEGQREALEQMIQSLEGQESDG